MSHGVHNEATITSALLRSFCYTLANIHHLHVILGMVLIFAVAAEAAKSQEPQRVENVGMYWHFVAIVWIILLPLLDIAQ